MSDDLEDLRAEMSSLPDKDLFDITAAGADEYRPDAIQFAREELDRRGANVATMKPSDVTADEDPFSEPPDDPRTGTVRHLMPGWWFWACLVAGLAVILCAMRVPLLQ